MVLHRGTPRIFPRLAVLVAPLFGAAFSRFLGFFISLSRVERAKDCRDPPSYELEEKKQEASGDLKDMELGA